MALIQIAHNAIKAKLIDAPKDVKLRVSALLSFRVEGVEHMAAFKNKTWDGRSSFFDFRQATFPAGFVYLVHSTLTQEGHTVQIAKKPFPAPLGEENPKVDAFPYDPKYDYQDQTVKRLLKHGQMIAQVATGGGKSRIAKLTYARIKRTTLFLTTRSVLMHQMKDAFEEDLGIKVGVIGEGIWNFNRGGMNVGMVQTIAPYVVEKTIDGELERYLVNQYNAEQKAIEDLKVRLKKEKADLPTMNKELSRLRKEQESKRLGDKELGEKIKQTVEDHNRKHKAVIRLLQEFELVILEEAHEAGGNGFYEIMNKCTNAHYRLSLTATPFMRDDEESNMRLMAVSGPVGIRITEKMLIDRGILAKPIFKYIPMAEPDPKKWPSYSKLRRTTPWQRAYKLGITDNEYRNERIVWEAQRAAQNGLTGMILVNHTSHGHDLTKMMKKAGIRVEFIYGKHEQSQRKAALKRLANRDIDFLIGSTILDVGVDVPAVGIVILAGGGKAEVALRQRIGRGLRFKKLGPNICYVVDFSDQRNEHLTAHAKQRRHIVESTPGFAENILKPGEDFDYSVFKKAA